MNDLRFAIRMLLKNPGFTAVALLSLAVGIGANTVVFCWIQEVLAAAAARRGPRPGKWWCSAPTHGSEHVGDASLPDLRDYARLTNVFSRHHRLADHAGLPDGEREARMDVRPDRHRQFL